MYVKQIGMEEALRLAGKGREIMVMVPGIEGENGWKDHTLDTLAGMLEGCMFFRKEPAAVVWDGLEEARVVPSSGGEATEFYGDGTARCGECGYHFGVVECDGDD